MIYIKELILTQNKWTAFTYKNKMGEVLNYIELYNFY